MREEVCEGLTVDKISGILGNGSEAKGVVILGAVPEVPLVSLPGHRRGSIC